MIINTSRGSIIDTKAAVQGLKSGQIGYLGIDVYEEESEIFFEDFSGRIIKDDVLARLLTFPNVIVTGHQAFFTNEALQNIANTTATNFLDFVKEKESNNELTKTVQVREEENKKVIGVNEQSLLRASSNKTLKQ